VEDDVFMFKLSMHRSNGDGNRVHIKILQLKENLRDRYDDIVDNFTGSTKNLHKKIIKKKCFKHAGYVKYNVSFFEDVTIPLIRMKPKEKTAVSSTFGDAIQKELVLRMNIALLLQ